MADMGKAISQKIREAIRAKLIDLGNYVDEELPDYIMVMIANKKTEEQMKDDLVLFLGANTEKFCSWLQGVLKKLQAARDEQKERKAKDGHKKKKSKKKDEKKEKTRRSSGDSKDEKKAGTSSLDGEDGGKQIPHTDTNKEGETSTQLDIKTSKEPIEAVEAPIPPSQPVISLLPDTNDILDQEIQMNEEIKKATTTDLNKPQAKSNIKIQSVSVSPQEKTKKLEKVSPKGSVKHLKERPPERVGESSGIHARVRVESLPIKGSVKSRLGVPAVKRKAQEEEKPQRVLTTMSTVVRVPMVTMKRSGPGSVIGQVIEDSDEESEPAVKRVASTVKPRRRQPLPKTKQNSMALLKKAMTQAQKSTSMFPAAGQFTEPRRMIVKSAAQPGTMKIVARSIPADQEPSKKKQSASLLTAAIKATTRDNPPAKAPATASRVSQSTKPSLTTGSCATQSKTSGTVRPLGLMSRSRFEEAKERDFDAHMYQRVEKETEEEEVVQEVQVVGKEMEEQEEEENEERKVVEEQEEYEENVVDDEGKEEEEEVTASSVDSQLESVDNEDDQRQIISMAEGDKSEAVAIMDPDEMDMKMVEMIDEEEGDEEEEEVEEEEVEEDEDNMEEEMPVYDTRNTTIVRPLQFDKLTSLQKRKPVTHPQPQPRVYPVSSPMPEDSNPRFIVTMEGKKQRPIFNQAPAMPPVPVYQPTPISRLAPNPQILLDRYETSEEMESLEEETFEQTQPMQYQQVILKDRSAMIEKEIPMKRVVPNEHQLVKDSLYSPPQPQVEPVTFSLQESDEEHSHVEMEEKVNERCKFWPACKNGSDCPFFHPSTPCRTFPNCKFGDKCLFIHPNCKFDATCMNPTCPYTHATRTKPAPVIIHAPPIRKFHHFKPTAASKPVCRFYPNCSNVKCPFFHPNPMLCRYNQSCTRPDCKFQHTKTKVAARSAMKWTKDQHISERKFVSKPSSSSNLPS